MLKSLSEDLVIHCLPMLSQVSVFLLSIYQRIRRRITPFSEESPPAFRVRFRIPISILQSEESLFPWVSHLRNLYQKPNLWALQNQQQIVNFLEQPILWICGIRNPMVSASESEETSTHQWVRFRAPYSKPTSSVSTSESDRTSTSLSVSPLQNSYQKLNPRVRVRRSSISLRSLFQSSSQKLQFRASGVRRRFLSPEWVIFRIRIRNPISKAPWVRRTSTSLSESVSD